MEAALGGRPYDDCPGGFQPNTTGVLREAGQRPRGVLSSEGVELDALRVPQSPLRTDRM